MKSSTSYRLKAAGGFRSVIRLNHDWRIVERQLAGHFGWFLQSRFSPGSPWVTRYVSDRKQFVLDAIVTEAVAVNDIAQLEISSLPERCVGSVVQIRPTQTVRSG